MAILSLGLTVIFGIAPLIYCIFLPELAWICVPAILLCAISLIIGLIGLISEMIKDKASRLSCCSLVFSIGVIFLLCGIISNNEGRPSERARRIACMGNLKQIHLALQQYAMDYDDNFPPANGAAGLEYLRKYNYLTDYAVYVCSSTKTALGKDKQPLTEETVDYVYVGGLNEKSDQKSPVLYDKPRNHEDFGNVLFADGTVSNFIGKNWTEKIKK